MMGSGLSFSANLFNRNTRCIETGLNSMNTKEGPKFNRNTRCIETEQEYDRLPLVTHLTVTRGVLKPVNGINAMASLDI